MTITLALLAVVACLAVYAFIVVRAEKRDVQAEMDDKVWSLARFEAWKLKQSRSPERELK
jgi:hypothetical protein